MFQEKFDSENKYAVRREIVFILFSGIFVGTLAMLNILGISRLIDLSFSLFGLHVPFRVFIGVLPYPVTFLCTDFISEFYGKKRASIVVWTGLVLNVWVLIIMWIGGIFPPHPELMKDGLPAIGDPQRTFFQIRMWTFGATLASMIAYLTAQFVDVHVFHFLKRKTKGGKLWIRNNGSTLTSQLVDSVSVVLITYFATNAIQIESGVNKTGFLMMLILSNYFFKMIAALVDTIPFYIGVRYLSRFLNLDPVSEYKNG